MTVTANRKDVPPSGYVYPRCRWRALSEAADTLRANPDTLGKAGRSVLPQVQCGQKTRDILGEDGIAEVTANLWAKDCQTCGQPLGSEPPALCVDDVREYATVTLHHPRCRPPGWNDGNVIYTTGGANLSWTSLSFLIPSKSGRKALDLQPAILLNPGLEMIVLEPRRGRWRPGYFAWFTSLGMVPPGRKLRLHRPLAGVSAWLADDLISVTVEPPPGSIYEANAAQEVLARARELRGVLLMVTHALDPASLYAAPDQAWRSVWQLMATGRVICGWADTDRAEWGSL